MRKFSDTKTTQKIMEEYLAYTKTTGYGEGSEH